MNIREIFAARLIAESDGLFIKKDGEWQQRYEKITPQMILEVYDEAAAIAEDG